MSFLIDGPWLYANGRAIARTDHPTELAAGTMAVFWGVSIPLYLNRRWTRPIWRACRASSGRDWMINSGVLKVDADTVSTRGHAISAAIFATYPLWLWLGLRHGQAMSEPRFPSVPAHKGHYESYYLRAADPAGGRSAWIRHTVFKRPGGPPTGALWCTLFEAGREPRAVKQSLPDPRRRRLADDRRQPLRPGRRERAGRGTGRAAQWDLTLRPLLRAAPAPAGEAVRGAAPAHEAREPAARHDDLRPRRGLGARRLARHGRPQLGRRARRALDLAARGLRGGRVARRGAGPGQGRARADAVDRQRRAEHRRRAPARRAGSRAVAARARTAARSRPAASGSRWPRRRSSRGSTPTPSGGEHRSTNCSIARVELTVDGRTLRTEHGGAWELGTREAPPGVEAQPYPDP